MRFTKVLPVLPNSFAPFLLSILWIYGLFVCHIPVVAQPTISVELFTEDFSNPVDIAHCKDERLFIVEQRAKISIIDGNATKLATPFLDITDSVATNGGEQGLLGLAFHPNYATNGYFYVYFTEKEAGNARLYRYKVSAGNPNLADETSALLLLEIEQPFNNHNGGCLKFGGDGYLYISSGDGGGGGDPHNFAQNPLDLKGKMLRIDIDHQDVGKNYAIPVTNPFYNKVDTLPEIWSLGWRNPWRFSFDRATNDMWIGDVGQGDWEEINYEPANYVGGGNYGWRCYEGNAPFNTTSCQSAATYIAPIHDYASNSTIGRSVTGGFVFRKAAVPTLYGKYIYGDFISGRIWAIDKGENGDWKNQELLDWDNFQISAFGENNDGDLFIAAYGAGKIYKIINYECVENHHLTGVLDYKTYQASDFINVSGTIDSGTFTALVAQNTITFEPGFYAKMGSELVAKIDLSITCSTNNLVRVMPNRLSEKKPFRPTTSLKLYPNIASDLITLELPYEEATILDQTTIFIYDAYGKQIQSLSHQNIRQAIDISHLVDGIYYLVISQLGNIRTQKFVKSSRYGSG